MESVLRLWGNTWLLSQELCGNRQRREKDGRKLKQHCLRNHSGWHTTWVSNGPTTQDTESCQLSIADCWFSCCFYWHWEKLRSRHKLFHCQWGKPGCNWFWQTWLHAFQGFFCVCTDFFLPKLILGYTERNVKFSELTCNWHVFNSYNRT